MGVRHFASSIHLGLAGGRGFGNASLANAGIDQKSPIIQRTVGEKVLGQSILAILVAIGFISGIWLVDECVFDPIWYFVALFDVVFVR